MDFQKAKAFADELKGLACIECTKVCSKKHEVLNNPIQDINILVRNFRSLIMLIVS